MRKWLCMTLLNPMIALVARPWRRARMLRDDTGWIALPPAAQMYVATVTLTGVVVMARFFPTTCSRPWMLASLIAFSCLTSLWKVTLPLGFTSGSTLSVSYAADLMALLLLGPNHAMVVAVAGVWAQCTFRAKEPYPWYRTAFSIAAEAITIQATGLVYGILADTATLMPVGFLARGVVAAIATYFVVNTGLVAGAIGLSTRRSVWMVWYENFLWSAPSFMVAGGAGALAALVIERGNPWLAILMLAPVYLSYRSYHVFLGRIEDERRHFEETERLHSETIDALLQARRAEQSLAEEKERLAVTLRSIGEGVITTDLEGRVLLINQAAETLTGWTLDDAAGHSLDAVFRSLDPETHQPRSNAILALAKQAEKGGVLRASVLVARDSFERPIEEVFAPLRDANGRTIGLVVVFRDITDALRVQEERAKAAKIASLGLLAGGIAHDFNDILMAIMGNLSVAQAASTDETSARALGDAERACLQARQLTWQLLTFARGGVPLKKTLAVSRLVKESVTRALRGSNVTSAFDIAPDLWDVPADEEQLTQVITDLVLNAQQSMRDGGAIDVRAENAIEPGHRWEHALRVEPGRYIRISVTDHGIGIPEQHLGRIFDPYFSTKEKASGLGLATAYSIVKNHGGYVSVASKPGQGTTLTVNLPVSTPDTQTRSIATMPARGSRILVMDDEATCRSLTVKMLRLLGHSVEAVHDGNAAVERYTHALNTDHPFDAILLDLIVPSGLGGREALELISEVDPSVKAIMVSGRARNSMPADSEDLGFKAVIAKPFTLEELRTTLRTVMVPGGWQVH
jgi:PAS domain S-box-containing protein